MYSSPVSNWCNKWLTTFEFVLLCSKALEDSNEGAVFVFKGILTICRSFFNSSHLFWQPTIVCRLRSTRLLFVPVPQVAACSCPTTITLDNC